MAETGLADVVRRIRRAVAALEMKDKSDSQLLHAFHAENDQDAFAALVHRHGAMILRVCRHVLRHHQDAEDAFQATFLVLARKAASLDSRKALAGWLHRVAYRIALQASRNIGRRQAREARAQSLPAANPVADVAWREVEVMLHEEIDRLSEKYRTPFVLCCLEGQSRADVAGQLNLKEGTIWSRLCQARRQLQKRLSRRGIELGTVLAAASVAEAGAASVLPALMVARTVRTVMTAGTSLAGISPIVADLSQAALHSMTAAKLKFGLALLLMTGVVGAGLVVAALQPLETKPAPASQQSADEKPKAENKKPEPRVDIHGDPLPDGAIARLGTLRLKHNADWHGNLPNTVASFTADGKSFASSTGWGTRLWDAVSGKEVSGQWAKMSTFAFVFSPDSTILATSGSEYSAKGDHRGTITLWDITGSKRRHILLLPKNHAPGAGGMAFTDGGKSVIAVVGGTVHWWDVASGKEVRSATPIEDKQRPAEATQTLFNSTLSPCGRYLALWVRWAKEGEVLPGQDALVIELASGKELWRIKSQNRWIAPRGMAFSGDGKTMAMIPRPDTVEIRDTSTGRLLAAPPLDIKVAGSVSDSLPTLQPGHPLTGHYWGSGLALSHDGNLLAISDWDSHVVIWSRKEAATFRELRGRRNSPWALPTQCLDFSPDGKTLLVGAEGDLRLYDIQTLKEKRAWDGHRGSVENVRFATGGKHLFTGSAQVGLHFEECITWDVATWKPLHTASIRDSKWPNVGVPSTEHDVFTGSEGEDRFNLFDFKNGELLGRLDVPIGQDPEARGFFAPGGKFYVLGGKDQNGKNIERLYSVPSGKRVVELPAIDIKPVHSPAMRPIAFSPDGRLVAVCGRDDGVMRVFETATGKLCNRFGEELNVKGRPILANLSFSCNGRLLAAWSKWGVVDEGIRVWDLAADGNPWHLPVEGENQDGLQLAWSPDDRLLAVGSMKIQLWELATLQVRRQFAGHAFSIRALAFSPDGRLLASASADTTSLIWKLSLSGPEPAIGVLDRGVLAEHWQALTDDAASAFAAMRALAAAPKESVPWIKEHLKPAVPVEAKRIDELITQLNHDEFKVRQKATVELQRIGERVVPALDKALDGNPAIESRLRVQDLRKRVTGLVLQGERLQTYRAVEVLEKIGTPPARSVLAGLAGGAKGALVTTQAQGALERLAK